MNTIIYSQAQANLEALRERVADQTLHGIAGKRRNVREPKQRGALIRRPVLHRELLLKLIRDA